MAHGDKYITNPLDLFMPSWNALWINIRSWLTLIAVGLASGIVVAFLFAGLNGGNLASLALGVVLVGLIALVAAILIYPALIKLELAGAAGQKMSFKEAYKSTKQYRWKMLLLLILTGLVVFGGVLLLIVPGIIFATWFAMAPYAMIDEDLDVMDSLKRSKEISAPRFFETAGAVFLPSAVSILMLIPILGMLATTALTIMLVPLLAVRYLQLKKHKPSKDNPPIHALNYVVLVIGIIATFMSFRANQQQKNPQQLPGLDYGTNQR